MSVRLPHPMCLAAMVLAGSSFVVQAQKPRVPDITVPDVLKTAGAYLQQYAQKLGAVVAEEEYTQREPAIPSANRRLVSEVAFIGLDNGQIAVFRDVASIDGRDVRPKEDRLAKLFASTPTQASQEQGKALTDEGARHYIGQNLRTLDIPTLALEFLRAEYQSQSEFTFDGGIRNQDGAQIATLKFKTDKNADVLPTPEGSTTSGKIWIDIATGAVRQTELVVTAKQFNFKTTTKYAHDKGLDLWVPSEMSQLTDVSNAAAGLSNMGAGGQMGSKESLEGRARYSKYRRTTQIP
jgi:hypothetical protein